MSENTITPWWWCTKDTVGYWFMAGGELIVLSVFAMVMTSQKLMGEKSLFMTSLKFLFEIVHKYVTFVMLPIMLKDDWLWDVDITFSCAVFYKGLIFLPLFLLAKVE